MSEKINMEKVAEKIEDVWRSIESIATEIGSRELQRELSKVEAIFKFATDILKDHERIMDGSFHIRFYDDEVVVEVTFDGIHMHTVFVRPDSTLSDIRQLFNDPRVVLKSALRLLVWGLRDASDAVSNWSLFMEKKGEL
jgi:hypothetical protein